MHIVEFLEARIAEEEAALIHAETGDSSIATTLAGRMLAECAQKRAIVEYWKQAADEEGISEPLDARGPLAFARRSVLAILAAGYGGHPDYSDSWRG